MAISLLPRYLECLRKQRVLAVSKVKTDPQLQEWRDHRWIGENTTALLDAPFYSDQFTGFLRFEQTKREREWNAYELSFAGAVADQTARALLNAERLKADQLVLESEKRMTMAADSAHLGMWMWGPSETSIWTSAKWREIHGYAPADAVGFGTLLQRIHPDDREIVEGAVSAAFKGKGPIHLQHRVHLPGGATRWIDMSGRLEPSPAGEARLIGISIDITERKNAEEAAREVSGKLITAQEDERRRIARDLHDDLNQRLALLSVETDLLGRIEKEPSAQAIIANIASRLSDVSSEIHKLSYRLHPAKLDQLGLVAATRSFCHELSARCGLPVHFTHEAIPRELDDTLALSFYRIVQESLQNTVKHSRATQAEVQLCRNDGKLTLTISDDGRGFDTANGAHKLGLGLVGMRERVRLIRGTILISSSPGKGTQIEVVAPLDGLNPQ